MAVSLTRFSWWLWGSKEKEAVSNGSSLSNSSEWGSGVRETDSVKFPTKLTSSRKVKKRWQSREERRVETERDVVFLSGSESDGPDWSIGWVEPHGSDFRSDDESDDGFAVLVPCYRPGCKELVETSSDQLLSAIKNLPNELSSEGRNYMEWLSSLQNF
ncbi:hypothetical protein HS088_TW03G00062 [Tripterygium wilfordii]|uniref:Uncharacterized protein n=1 Tax=Tripterygium wilfordii TaxID=458696 RepID=A0A7J7DTU6_TRIWF|nr:uncharacterized protein LOC119985193 [Tripterygium wilfordii]KAF5749737.1 hypothetical protein HS088_TW03G00062 [Tripterygium wilfordii]